MNRNDVIDVLTAVAAGDRRTVGEADVALWCQVIGDLPKDLALKAVVYHFRERPGVWLEPGHIVQHVRAARREMREKNPDYDRMAAICDGKAAPDDELAQQRRKQIDKFATGFGDISA